MHSSSDLERIVLSAVCKQGLEKSFSSFYEAKANSTLQVLQPFSSRFCRYFLQCCLVDSSSYLDWCTFQTSFLDSTGNEGSGRAVDHQ